MGKLTNPSYVAELLKRYGFSFSHKLGQNFLISEAVCSKIAEAGVPNSDAVVIEIGAGIGTLTAELAARASQVFSFELDSRLIPLLDETLSDYSNVKIINEDFTKFNFEGFFEKLPPDAPVYVCANLPYYVTTPIIMRILEEAMPVSAITVMVQREAAQRLCASPGVRESGSISAAIRFYSEPTRLFDVAPGSFMPAPKVTSSVIRLELHEPILPPELAPTYFSLVRAAFAQRRKTLKNALMSGLSCSEELVRSALDSAGLSPQLRAEQLTLEQLTALTVCLKDELDRLPT